MQHSKRTDLAFMIMIDVMLALHWKFPYIGQDNSPCGLRNPYNPWESKLVVRDVGLSFRVRAQVQTPRDHLRALPQSISIAPTSHSGREPVASGPKLLLELALIRRLCAADH